jgi:hypothetical protein
MDFLTNTDKICYCLSHVPAEVALAAVEDSSLSFRSAISQYGFEGLEYLDRDDRGSSGVTSK